MTARSEDLMDIYRQAVANDSVLATADATRLAIAEGVPQARSALLPQVSANLTMDQIHSGTESSTTDGNGNTIPNSAGGHTRARDLGFNLSQPILSLSNIATLNAARSIRDAQEQTYEAALQNLYARVATAYFNALTAEADLDVYKSYEDAYKKEYEAAKTRFENGLTANSDVTQSQAYYLYIKSQRITVQNVLKDDLRALEQITGQPVHDLRKLRKDIPMNPPEPANADAWVKQATETSPTILAARYTVSADEKKIHAARAQHLPTLNLDAGYSKVGSWSNVSRGTAAYQPGTTVIGLSLNVPIFSGGLTQSQVRQAIYQRDEDQGNLETQRRQAARDAYNYYNLVVDGIDQVQTAKDSVEAAEKSLASMQAGYDVGTQSLTNVVFAIETLADIQSQYTSVRHQFILNKLLLKQAAGTVAMQDLEDINRLLE
jgi:outer membrane protein